MSLPTVIHTQDFIITVDMYTQCMHTYTYTYAHLVYERTKYKYTTLYTCIWYILALLLFSPLFFLIQQNHSNMMSNIKSMAPHIPPTTPPTMAPVLSSSSSLCAPTEHAKLYLL